MALVAFDWYAFGGGGSVQLWRVAPVGRLVASRSSAGQSLNHVTDYGTLDAYYRPAMIEEYSAATPAVKRVTTRQYYDIAEHTQGRHVLGLVAQETVTLNGTSVTRQYAPDPTTGFRLWQRVAGIETTFTPDGLGNVASETTDGVTTTYTYSWGQVSSVSTSVQTTTRGINPDGTIASETLQTSPARTTTYWYDAMGRLTQTQGPGGTAPVVTEYDNVTGRAVTTRRGTGAGQSVVTTWFDGFGRAIETVDSSGVRTKTG